MSDQGRTIYVDESGYSGGNFVDKEKPLFVVATLAVEPDEAVRLRDEHFGKVAAAELKHSRLVGRAAQRAMVLSFLSDIASRKCVAKVWAAEKRYAGWLKIVEHLVEPHVLAQGGSLYAKGGHVALASMLYCCLPATVSPEIADSLLMSTTAVMRPGTAVERVALRARLESLCELGGKDAREFLMYLLAPLQRLPDDEFDDQPPGAMDMSLGAAVQLLAAWRTETDGPLRVIHDSTANMSRHKDVLDGFVGAAIDPRLDKSSSGMSMMYPIDARLTFEASDGNVGLQLADVLAGALGCCFDLRREDKERAAYAEAVLERLGGGIDVHALLPHMDIRPEAMGTDDIDVEAALSHTAAQVRAGRVPLPKRHGKAKGQRK